MKKMVNTLVLVTAVVSAIAQTPEDYPTSFDKASGKIYLPAAIRLLEDGKKMVIQMPEKQKYNAGHEVPGFSLKLGPKEILKASGADYVFRVSSPGLNYTPATPVYIAENRTATYYAPAANVKGYVFNVRYLLPVTVELVNKTGEVEKTFHFNTDSATMTVHANFLLDIRTTEDWKPLKLTAAFPTGQAANDYFKKNEQAILKRMEYNVWYYASDQIKQVLEIAYSNYRLPVDDFYAKVFLKKGKSQYPVLMDNAEKLRDLIGDLDDEKKGVANMEELKKIQSYFDTQVDSIANYGPKSQTVVLSHAAWGALLSGQREKAASHFTRYYLVENDDYNMFSPFKSAYLIYHLHDELKQAGAVIEPDTDISFLTPAKIPSPGIDPSLINITRKDGEVEKENGEVIKGQISIDFVAKNGGIVDLDLGKAATVYFTKNGGETYQFAKVNNTKRITIGDRMFEPVSRKTSAVSGLLNAAGGDFGNTYFMERLYEKNGYAVYRYWSPGEIILIKSKDDKAVDLGSVIAGRKVASKILDSTKGSEEFIKTNNLRNTIDDAKKLVDFMAVGGN